MNCKAARRMMSAFLDGELPEINTNQLIEHIDSCAACRVEMNALNKINTTLDAWSGIAPTFSLADVKRHVFERQAETCHFRTFNRFKQIPRWATAILAIFAILIGTVGGAGLEAILQPSHQNTAASSLVADTLSLARSDDPMVYLISAETLMNPVVFSNDKVND